jgi:NHL repeat
MKWDSEGEDEGEFRSPYSIVFDPSTDDVYVVDRGNDRIQRFDTEGNFIEQWTETGVTGGGDDEGVFSSPEVVWSSIQTRDLRDVLAIGKLTKNTEDVEFIATTLQKYKRRNEQE